MKADSLFLRVLFLSYLSSPLVSEMCFVVARSRKQSNQTINYSYISQLDIKYLNNLHFNLWEGHKYAGKEQHGYSPGTSLTDSPS